MADADLCVPVSIGFGKTALVPARIEYSVWQLGVRSRKHATTTCGISTFGTWLPGKNQLPTQAPEWITVPGIASWIQRNRRECYVPLDSWSSTYGTLKESGGGGGGSQRMFIHWKCSFRDIMRSHVSRWIVETGQGSGVLEVFRGVPEFVSARHALCCWGHVNTGSSGGCCTTRSGSRTSSPTSIAYTICMQPLLQRS